MVFLPHSPQSRYRSGIGCGKKQKNVVKKLRFLPHRISCTGVIVLLPRCTDGLQSSAYHQPAVTAVIHSGEGPAACLQFILSPEPVKDEYAVVVCCGGVLC